MGEGRQRIPAQIMKSSAEMRVSMKKTVIATLTCLMVFSSVLPVSAHRHDYCGGQDCAEYGCFIDENEDGICDNSLCLDADGNSVCGAGHHACAYFIDEDEDGVCDHCTEKTYTRSCHRQRGGHHRRGHH